MLRPKEDIGAHVVVKKGTPPFADTGSTVNGASIDRMGYMSCVLALSSGAATGTPSAQTADAKLQESADESTWTDIAGAAATQQIADDGHEEIDVNLTMVERYIRVVTVVGFTAGTSPTWPVATEVVLGGDDVLPAADYA